MSGAREAGSGSNGDRGPYADLYMEELPAGWFVCAGCMGAEPTDKLAGYVLSPAKNRFPLCGECYQDACKELPGHDLRANRKAAA